jgi:hypothetical protein
MNEVGSEYDGFERWMSRHEEADFANQSSREAGRANFSSVNDMSGGFWRPTDAWMSCMNKCKTSLGSQYLDSI